MNLECEICGLQGSDLPEDVEPVLFFEQTGMVTHCVTCNPQEFWRVGFW